MYFLRVLCLINWLLTLAFVRIWKDANDNFNPQCQQPKIDSVKYPVNYVVKDT